LAIADCQFHVKCIESSLNWQLAIGNEVTWMTTN
jgi:hypothetical protein